jgi:GntR family transcriptional regulator/MocR family aminotransferase
MVLKTAKVNIQLDKESTVSLSQQIYESLRNQILNGDLKPGDRLPAARNLSKSLDISRPTLATSLEQLELEGYLEIRQGSGAYVCTTLKQKPNRDKEGQGPAKLPISEYGEFLEALPEQHETGTTDQSEPEICFYPWRPALDQFPLEEWARILGRQARNSDLSVLDYVFQAQGDQWLREEICGMVARFRGVKCTPEQVIITMGLNQGLNIAASLHLRNGSSVVVEDPGYSFAWSIFRGHGANVVPISVDAQGLRVDWLADTRNAKLVYVMPAHQFPTGGVMPLTRRLELLEWARRKNAIILEDDYDSEYQDHGKPIPALMSLDTSGCVVYAGSLNQLMFPSLGLGFLLVPPHMVSLYTRARQYAGEQLSVHLQRAIAEFIQEGHLDRHIKRLRGLYSERRNVLVQALVENLGGKCGIVNTGAGVFVLARFKSKYNDEEIMERAKKQGVGLVSSKSFYLVRAPRNEFILGTANLDEEQILEGVARLAKIIG